MKKSLSLFVFSLAVGSLSAQDFDVKYSNGLRVNSTDGDTKFKLKMKIQNFISKSLMHSTLVALLIVFSTGAGSAQGIVDNTFGKGIKYVPVDESFSVRFHYRMQQLTQIGFDEATGDVAGNFMVRRSRLKFDGHAYSDKLKYKVELGLTSRDISTNKEDGNTGGSSRIILDAVLKYQFSSHWSVWVGQTKLPGNRERVISSANLQFVDRSNVNSKFNIDRDAGFQLRGKYAFGTFRIHPSVAITKGEGRDISSSNFGGLNYTGHVDVLPLGKFTGKGDYIGGAIHREEKPKISFGFTYNLNQGAVRQQGQLGSFVSDSLGDYVENDLTAIMADMMFKYRGWSLMSEYAYTVGNNSSADVSKGFNTGNGFSIQAGYMFKNNYELATRYTTVRNDGSLSGIKDQDEITLGFSKYIVGHSLKIQSDIARVTTPGSSDGDLRFRLQVEMQF